jgi:hypothetical protein
LKRYFAEHPEADDYIREFCPGEFSAEELPKNPIRFPLCQAGDRAACRFQPSACFCLCDNCDSCDVAGFAHFVGSVWLPSRRGARFCGVSRTALDLAFATLNDLPSFHIASARLDGDQMAMLD